MKPASQITDRAKRYRANQNKPAGPRRCNFCASRKNIDVDHIGGDERDNEPENLMYLCRPCNARKGVTQARNKIGVRTAQFNPHRKTTFAQFRNAAAILLGIRDGDAGQATAAIRAATPEDRIKFADAIEAANPFKTEARRKKMFVAASSRPDLLGYGRNPEVPPTFGQYVHAVAAMHSRGAHDEGGKVIHATPPELRSQYARQIARTKSRRRSEVPF